LVHELRTPITPILAASELLVDEMKGSPMYNLATNIQRSATNLNKRIGELLDLARGEVGQIKLNIMPVNIGKLLEDTTGEARSQATLKNQTITLEIKSPLKPIMADEERVQQVVLNLLNNSIKFTQNGGSIILRAREDEKDLIVEVEDNGRGISEEEQKRLFDPYHRRESDRDRLSGLGLGLAISKKFVELHGGKIWATSTQGKGTIFTFSIPLKPVPDDK
jgi:two-component system, OmpR family, aerobic respiration control sensor histidine kinase ArcB